jgi:acyl-CoA synthetase (AMP-forming)/AMP-acid ligase II
VIGANHPEFGAQWRAASLHGGVSIAQEIERAARASPETRLYFASADRERSASFAEIGAAMERYASGMARSGLKRGDTIAVQAPHSLENMLLFAAAMRLGLRYVPIVGIYGPTELDFILGQTEPVAFAVPETARGVDVAARTSALTAPALKCIIVLEGDGAGHDFGHETIAFAALEGSADAALPPHAGPDDHAIILYTSGSTGVAKGAIHSHESALAELRAAAKFIAQTGHTPVLSPLPTGHVAGIMAMLRPFVHEISAVFMDHWNAEQAAGLISKHQIGWSYGTPFHLIGLLEKVEAGGLPTLKSYQIGGAGVPSELIRRADAAGISACRGYGSTEEPTITANVPHDPLEKRAETDGRAAPGVHLKLVDDHGNKVADGVPGEIVCVGPEQFLGYLDASHNNEAFDDDNWFRTGDIGVRDADGYVAIVDRKKDIIIRAGENIAPKEVEDILMRLPAVAEAAVVGVPDATYGERVAAVVILRSGTLDLDDLKRHFRAAGVAIQKTPERLFIVDDFPRTPLGKIHKRDLRRRITESSS